MTATLHKLLAPAVVALLALQLAAADPDNGRSEAQKAFDNLCAEVQGNAESATEARMIEVLPMCMSCGDCTAICPEDAIEIKTFIEFKRYFRYIDRGKPEPPRKL